MRLGDLLHEVRGAEIGAPADLDITSLAYNSQQVQPGALFFAIVGAKTDGHHFVPEALARGALAVVSEREAPAEHARRWVRVPRIRRALAEIARRFYGEPDSRLRLIGITGTNGKTTTAFLLTKILETAGEPTALFGTIEYRLSHRVAPAVNTTPESLDLQALLAEAVTHQTKAAVMEVSSHALAQERVWGFRFAAALFTNLTRDHLDYHQTMEEYFQAKRRLFEGLGAPPPELAVINLDDPRSSDLLHLPYMRFITWGIDSAADVTTRRYSLHPGGLRATLVTPEGKIDLESPLVGRANLANILAASAAAYGLGVAGQKIAEGVASLSVVPGRFERVDQGQPYLVVVDYAHTDDALRNVLATARELCLNRLIVVFGCGGDRDRTKRPLMGEAAGSLSDLAILTSDNPRSEDPLRIMSDAMVGLQKAGRPYLAEVDREAAIRRALGEARAGDVVVLAGKGHETYQVLKDRTVPFDDREVARQVLAELGYPGAHGNGRKKNSR